MTEVPDRCIMTVHAHPDDEASKGAGTIAKAKASGAKTVLVCCTGGEAGDILNPAMDSDEVRAPTGPRRDAAPGRPATVRGERGYAHQAEPRYT